MLARTTIATVLFLGFTAALAQHTAAEDCPMHAQSVEASPYAGQQARQIKALSVEETEQLLAGHGMGLAKAAELNGFPGPKHVLELAEALKLSAEQRETTRRIFDEMHEKVTDLGRRIVEGEAALDGAFADGEIDQGRLGAHVREIGRLQTELRLAHLEAHLSMRAALDDAQAAEYDRLRGYR